MMLKIMIIRLASGDKSITLRYILLKAVVNGRPAGPSLFLEML